MRAFLTEYVTRFEMTIQLHERALIYVLGLILLPIRDLTPSIWCGDLLFLLFGDLTPSIWCGDLLFLRYGFGVYHGPLGKVEPPFSHKFFGCSLSLWLLLISLFGYFIFLVLSIPFELQCHLVLRLTIHGFLLGRFFF